MPCCRVGHLLVPTRFFSFELKKSDCYKIVDVDYNVLTINTGKNFTKIAFFINKSMIFESINNYHPKILAPYSCIVDQLNLRIDSVLDCLRIADCNLEKLDAVVGCGGLLSPLESGTYEINQTMLDEMRVPGKMDHSSNLGVLIANEIAKMVNARAFTVDPVAIDELEPIARFSGLANIERKSFSHALNIKYMARRAATALGKDYVDLNLIVAHLGGEISITAHRKGRMVDVTGGADAGPFSPERAGYLPSVDLIDLCYSGITKEDLKKTLTEKGGFVSYLGTNSFIEVDDRIRLGDKIALLVGQAMAYQIAKSIGGMSTVLDGNVDAIVLTGGCAYWNRLCEWIKGRVRLIGMVLVYPGENEMVAMAEGGLRVLRGEEEVKVYCPSFKPYTQVIGSAR